MQGQESPNTMFTAVFCSFAFEGSSGRLPTLLCPRQQQRTVVRPQNGHRKEGRGAKGKKGQEGRQSNGRRGSKRSKRVQSLRPRPTARWRHGAHPANAVLATECSAAVVLIGLVVLVVLSCVLRQGGMSVSCTWNGRER